MSTDERLRRWRLVLGSDPNEGEGTGETLEGEDQRIDRALASLYNRPAGGDPRDARGRKAGLGGSAPAVARWLGDIRTYFPSTVVQVMQKDAIDRLGLDRLLLEPEVLETVTPDIHLATTLISLQRALPAKSRETARQVIRKVVDDIEERLASKARQAVSGALDRSSRTSRPKFRDVDWNRTIQANLKHYQPEHRTVVPERLVGYARRRKALGQDLVLALDQSGSMASSVVYAGVLGAALASLPALSTRLVAFDTAVVDLTDELDDPVDLLFGVQLGGGTDIDLALGYCQTVVHRPASTVLVLVTDLFEGGDERSMLRRVAALIRSGVTVIVLLALDDDGAPAFDHHLAAAVSALGAPVFACTPDQFPDMLAAAIEKRSIAQWAAGEGIALAGGAVDESAGG